MTAVGGREGATGVQNVTAVGGGGPAGVQNVTAVGGREGATGVQNVTAVGGRGPLGSKM